MKINWLAWEVKTSHYSVRPGASTNINTFTNTNTDIETITNTYANTNDLLLK